MTTAATVRQQIDDLLDAMPLDEQRQVLEFIQLTVGAAGQLYVPSVVVGELFEGAYRIESTRRGQALLA